MKLMKLFQSRGDVRSAERRLTETRRATHASIMHVRSAIHSRLTHPSSLLAVTGLGLVVGMRLGRKTPLAKPVVVSTPARIVSFASDYLSRFGVQRLADAWMRLRDPALPRNENTSTRV